MQPPIPTTRPTPRHKRTGAHCEGSGPKWITRRATVSGNLAWGDVDHHAPTARAPLASYPRTTLHVVHTSLEASHAGALFVRTPSYSSHDHAISSSTSWSKRSSKLGLIRPLLVAHMR
jgi:hypothetical protein